MHGIFLCIVNTWPYFVLKTFGYIITSLLAPVPLSIFRSNSKFDENSKHSSVNYTRPITTIFCTRHDNVTVVTCAKCRCDRSIIFGTRAFWIFIEFRIMLSGKGAWSMRCNWPCSRDAIYLFLLTWLPWEIEAGVIFMGIIKHPRPKSNGSLTKQPFE